MKKWKTLVRRSIQSSGSGNNDSDRGFSMFRYIRRWFDTYKKSLFDSYEPPKPAVYKIGNKKYVRVKRLRTTSKDKGPYLK